MENYPDVEMKLRILYDPVTREDRYANMIAVRGYMIPYETTLRALTRSALVTLRALRDA